MGVSAQRRSSEFVLKIVLSPKNWWTGRDLNGKHAPFQHAERARLKGEELCLGLLSRFEDRGDDCYGKYCSNNKQRCGGWYFD